MKHALKLDDQVFTSIDDCESHVASQQTTSMVVRASSLRVEDAGLFVAEHLHPLTETGQMGLLNLLQIPQKFALDVCDTPMICHVANGLLARHGDETVRVVLSRHGVVGVMKASSLPLLHAEVLRACRTESASPTTLVALRNGELRMCIKLPFNTGDKVGDVVHAGWEVISREDGLGPTTVSAYLYFLKCKNGAVFGRRIGGCVRHPDADQPTKNEVLRDIHAQITTTCLTDSMLRALERSRQEQLGAVAPRLLARIHPLVAKTVFDHRFAPNITSATTFFDAVNRVTEYAHALDGKRRRVFERLGGSLIEVFHSALHIPSAAARCGALASLWRESQYN